MKKVDTVKPKKKKWPAILAVIVVLCAVASLGGGNSSNAQPGDMDSVSFQDASADTSELDAPQVETENTDIDDTATIEFGDLLSIIDNRENGGVVVAKAKITPNLTNNLTINQNYHNAVGLIKSHEYSDCEFQYWAVADMSDGDEGKVISFTVPANVTGQVVAGNITATQLPDYVTDLWILPSLNA